MLGHSTIDHDRKTMTDGVEKTCIEEQRHEVDE